MSNYLQTNFTKDDCDIVHASLLCPCSAPFKMQSPVPPPWTWSGDFFVAAGCRSDAAWLLRSPASSFCFSPDLWGSLCLDAPSQVLLFSPAAVLEETEATWTGHVQVLQPQPQLSPDFELFHPRHQTWVEAASVTQALALKPIPALEPSHRSSQPAPLRPVRTSEPQNHR